MISGYQYACEDLIEPISDGFGEQVANGSLYNWISGGTISYDAADMTADLAAGVATHFGSTVTVAAVANAYTFVSDPTNPRWTWTTVSSAGSAVLVSGTAAATPSVPEYGDRVPNSLNLVQAGQTIAANITYKLDKRIPGLVQSGVTGTLNDFQSNKHLFALFAGGGAAPATPAGLGMTGGSGAEAVTAIGGEPLATYGATAAANIGLFSGTDSLISPNHSPSLLMRIQIPVANADVTYWIAGFFIGAAAAPTAMAGLRVVTTGNVFFVTRVAAAETTTDLGVLSRTAMLGFQIGTIDAGVTWVCKNQAGTVLATHTGNPPVVTTGMQYGVKATIATNPRTFSVAYVEGVATFA